MNFEHEYLTKQIIAYIGNKRKLLPLIYKAVCSIYPDIGAGIPAESTFLDLFSGSGVVSRFAKFLNFKVYSNDWEEYSFIINSAYLGINAKDIPFLFGSFQTLAKLLEDFNRLENPGPDEQYIAKYYAPASFHIEKTDFKKERLFYTRDNALAIDKIRNKLDILFPPEESDAANMKKRHLVLSLLLYEAATHTNTSGVFKACHKGFGGHGSNALTRILSPIQLHMPVLIDSRFPCTVFKEDANRLIKNNAFSTIDIAYLDPPYNQHQYGSNYHMLNTIALWDRIPAPLLFDEQGVLKEKAAIRKDWIKTRSLYCYRDKALAVFKDLIENIDAHYILISYSTEGIIPFHDMKDICLKKGELSIVTNEYTKYRGGKQSNGRLNTNIEFILIIDTKKKPGTHSAKKIDEVILRKSVGLLFTKRFSQEKLKKHFTLDEQSGVLETNLKDKKITLQSIHFFELLFPGNLKDLDLEELEMLHTILLDCVCMTKEEEIHELLLKIDEVPGENSYFIKFLPDTLKKIAHKKNKDKFYFWLHKIRQLKNKHEESYEKIENKINAIEKLAEKRFRN
ncbi:MAG: DNA adenine methylase [Spirochaetales bacterium]|nr:DNA adenine methylase [Spirochaetales bacterium]